MVFAQYPRLPVHEPQLIEKVYPANNINQNQQWYSAIWSSLTRACLWVDTDNKVCLYSEERDQSNSVNYQYRCWLKSTKLQPGHAEFQSNDLYLCDTEGRSIGVEWRRTMTRTTSLVRNCSNEPWCLAFDLVTTTKKFPMKVSKKCLLRTGKIQSRFWICVRKCSQFRVRWWEFWRYGGEKGVTLRGDYNTALSMILETKKILCSTVRLDVCPVLAIGNCFSRGFASKTRHDWGGNNAKDNLPPMVPIRERRMCPCMVSYNHRLSFSQFQDTTTSVALWNGSQMYRR